MHLLQALDHAAWHVHDCIWTAYHRMSCEMEGILLKAAILRHENCSKASFTLKHDQQSLKLHEAYVKNVEATAWYDMSHSGLCRN